MSEIPSFTPSVMPPLTQSADDAGKSTALQPTPSLDTARPVHDVSAQALPPAGKSGGAQSPGAALISNANGAPAIGNVTVQFSAEDMAAVLLTLQGKTQDAQLRTAKEGLGVSRLKMEQQHKKSMEKIDQWIKKCESAASKSKIGKIFGWVSKIATFLASAIATAALAVATPFSAGATAPLLALSVISLVGSTMSLASAISQAAGGPSLEISSLMTKACSAFLKMVGVPEDKLEAASRVMAGAIGLAAGATILADSQVLGNLAAGITQLSTNNETTAMIMGAVFSALAGIATAVFTTVATGGAGGAKAVSELTRSIPQAAKVAQHATGAIAGASSLVSGGLNVAVSFDEHAAATAQVDRQKFAALIAKLQAQMEEDHEEIKKVVQQIQEGYSVVSQMIASAGQSRSQITANLGRAMA